MRPTIALTMIVRNEEKNLARCLESAKNIVDEIVIVDTGSSDQTREIAKQYTGKVYEYSWQDDFSAARNFSLDQTQCEWILYLDADETLLSAQGDIYELISNSEGYEAFLLPMHNYASSHDGNYREFMVLRLFRNDPCYRFIGVIHEQVTLSRSEAVGVATSPAIMHHHCVGQTRNVKRGRNLQLLKKAVDSDPTNPFLQYYLGVERLGLSQPAKALPLLQAAYAQLTDAHIMFRLPTVQLLISCLQALGQSDDALLLCFEESQHYPSFPDLFYQAGVLLEEKGDYEVAVRWFTAAIDCGTPPSHMGHINGTESFLSYHQLGCCFQQLGRLREARERMERSLQSNPDYLYPLHSLCLYDLSEYGPNEAYCRLEKSGYIQRYVHRFTLADIFFDAGYPEQAALCLEINLPTGELPKEWVPFLARYQLYAGRLDEAISLYSQDRDEWNERTPEYQMDQVLALLLTGEYHQAKTRVFASWRKPETRSMAWVLLDVIDRLLHGRGCGRPEVSRESGVTLAGLLLLESLWRFLPQPGSGLSATYYKIVLAALQSLQKQSDQSYLGLDAYLIKKAQAVRQMLVQKYGVSATNLLRS